MELRPRPWEGSQARSPAASCRAPRRLQGGREGFRAEACGEVLRQLRSEAADLEELRPGLHRLRSRIDLGEDGRERLEGLGRSMDREGRQSGAPHGGGPVFLGQLAEDVQRDLLSGLAHGFDGGGAELVVLGVAPEGVADLADEAGDLPLADQADAAEA